MVVAYISHKLSLDCSSSCGPLRILHFNWPALYCNKKKMSVLTTLTIRSEILGLIRTTH